MFEWLADFGTVINDWLFDSRPHLTLFMASVVITILSINYFVRKVRKLDFLKLFFFILLGFGFGPIALSMVVSVLVTILWFTPQIIGVVILSAIVGYVTWKSQPKEKVLE